MSRCTLFPLVLVGTAIVVAGLTGCSAGGLPGVSPAGGAGSGTNAGSSSAAVAGGGSSGGTSTAFTLPTTCLSASDVSSTLGIAAHEPTVSSDSTSLVCEYLDASHDGPIIDIEPNKQGSTSANFVSRLKGGSSAPVTPVSGIGDAAALLTIVDGRTMFVLAGKYTIDIAGGAASDSALKKLATKILLG